MNKKFKEGMIAGTKPFNKKFKEQEDAIHRVSEQIRGYSNVQDKVIDILEDHDNQLESIRNEERYGLVIEESFDNFSHDEKLIACGWILTIMNTVSGRDFPPNEKQQQYFNNLLSYLEVSTIPQGIHLDAISEIRDIDKQQNILKLFLEITFLYDNSFLLLEELSDILEIFHLRPVEVEQEKQYIIELANALGSDALLNRYRPQTSISSTMSSIEVQLEQLEENTEEKELYVIDKSMTVGIGEVLSIVNKDVHFEETIFIYGTLEIVNSNIFFDKGDLLAISSFSDSNVVFKNCSFSREGTYPSPIMEFKSSDILFEQCRFFNISIFDNAYYHNIIRKEVEQKTDKNIDLSEFRVNWNTLFKIEDILSNKKIGVINSTSSVLVFEECYFLNGSHSFLNHDIKSDTTFNNCIIENHTGTFVVQNGYLNEALDGTSLGALKIKSCSFTNINHLKLLGIHHEYAGGYLIQGSSISIYDCSFKSCNIVLLDGKGNIELSRVHVQESKAHIEEDFYKYCLYSINGLLIDWRLDENNYMNISNCVFEDTGLININGLGETIFENVKFENITGDVIKTLNSKVAIIKCQFIKCKYSKVSWELIKIVIDHEDYVSRIESSLFKECDMENRSLIESRGYSYGHNIMDGYKIAFNPLSKIPYMYKNEKIKKVFTSLVVRNCIFNNCKYDELMNGIQTVGSGILKEEKNCIKSINNTIID